MALAERLQRDIDSMDKRMEKTDSKLGSKASQLQKMCGDLDVERSRAASLSQALTEEQAAKKAIAGELASSEQSLSELQTEMKSLS